MPSRKGSFDSEGGPRGHHHQVAQSARPRPHQRPFGRVPVTATAEHGEWTEKVAPYCVDVLVEKPFAASLVDAIAMAELSRRHKVPVFSCSGKRYQAEYATLLDEATHGAVTGCDVYGTTRSVPNHPDLFWYGVHGSEILYTILGSGCESVTAVQTQYYEQVTGVWADGKVGTFRGIRETAGKSGFGVTVFAEKKIIQSTVGSDKVALMKEIARFFKTGKSPLKPETTVEILSLIHI